MIHPAGGNAYPMTLLIWLPALVKALATALIVVTASAMAEALGPFWGALIASLPVSAGPAYVFLSMQHSEEFVAVSALSSFATNAATGLFLIVYGFLARHQPPWRGLSIAILAWLAGSFITQRITWSPATALLLNLVVYGAGFVLLNIQRGTEIKPASPIQRRWFDLPLRAISVAAFVSLVVAVSAALGPSATGIAAVFPISLISLIVIVRPRIGALAASLLAANALRAMLGFGIVLLTLHLAVRPLGATTALILAALISALWSGGLLLLKARALRFDPRGP